MESFWDKPSTGVEVKVGETATCNFSEQQVMYLTQVALGQSPRENEGVSVNLSVGEKTFLIGTLRHGRCDQIGLKLIFKNKFDISHSSKNASVYFFGYCRDKPADKYPLCGYQRLIILFYYFLIFKDAS